MKVSRIELGDQVTVKMLPNEKHTATAIAFDGDDVLFCFDQCLDDTYAMNENNSNDGGYPESDLRKVLQGIALHFPSKLQKRMVAFENGDFLRLPTREELFGRDEYTGNTYEDSGKEQIPYFKDEKNRVATVKGETYWYWLENKAVANSADFATCNSNGASNTGNAGGSGGVRPLFKIRNR